MEWRQLTSESQLRQIKDDSRQKPQAIFKHSTRCSISSMARQRLEREWLFSDDELPAYHLDLIAYRRISSQIAEDFGVTHQSPQLLIIKDGKCIYDASHNSIRVKDMSVQA